MDRSRYATDRDYLDQVADQVRTFAKGDVHARRHSQLALLLDHVPLLCQLPVVRATGSTKTDQVIAIEEAIARAVDRLAPAPGRSIPGTAPEWIALNEQEREYEAARRL